MFLHHGSKGGGPRGKALRARLPWRAGAVSLSLMLSCRAAGAEEPDKRVVTISEVTIVGRVQRPIAAVDVSRIQPQLTLSELKQSFTDRIERALYRSPF